jgi:hypothetical protein
MTYYLRVELLCPPKVPDQTKQYAPLPDIGEVSTARSVLIVNRRRVRKPLLLLLMDVMRSIA